MSFPSEESSINIIVEFFGCRDGHLFFKAYLTRFIARISHEFDNALAIDIIFETYIVTMGERGECNKGPLQRPNKPIFLTIFLGKILKQILQVSLHFYISLQINIYI